MPGNPYFDVAPLFIPNQAPASAASYHPDGGGAVNPYSGTVNDTNAAGTQEALAAHVAAVIAFALLGVFVLRATGFKFVVAGGVG